MSGDLKSSDSHPTILHIMNTAGVACTLAKWTNKIYKAHTDVLASSRHDPFGHLTYGTEWTQLTPRFFPFVIKSIKDFDIVHLHERDRFILKIRKHYPDKPVVMHYHGTDVRGRWGGRQRFWGRADIALASTINLLEGAPLEVVYVPNPIDTDMFHPISYEVEPNSALTFNHGAVDVAERLAKEHDLDLTVHIRDKPFTEMPNLLRQFSWYIDTKRNNKGTLLCRSGGSGSKTALEALACGLKVINSDGDIREELPPQHRAENVVRMLHPIYMSLMP